VIRRCLALLAAVVLCVYATRAQAEPPASGDASSAGAAAKPGKADGDDDEDETDEEESKDRKSSYRVHPSGRRYRVRFDPASRVTVGAGLGVMHDGEGSALAAFEAGFSFSYRKVYRFGGGADRITWQIDHQLTSGLVRPFVRHGGDVPSMDAVLYRATLLRHSESPSIVLPMSPPVTIGFPFDVGLDAELGRVTVPVTPVALPGVSAEGAPLAPGPAVEPWLHLGVARVSFTLDPWRSGQVGRSLALGVGVRYDVDVYPSPTLQTPVFVHRVAPLTSGSARFRYQTDDGLLMLDAYGEVAPHWTSEGRWDLFANVSARLDRTLIAINDQPIGAYAEAGYRYLPEGAGAPALHDVRATLGIAASLSLK
jgi:hypothetical protein